MSNKADTSGEDVPTFHEDFCIGEIVIRAGYYEGTKPDKREGTHSPDKREQHGEIGRCLIVKFSSYCKAPDTTSFLTYSHTDPSP